MSFPFSCMRLSLLFRRVTSRPTTLPLPRPSLFLLRSFSCCSINLAINLAIPVWLTIWNLPWFAADPGTGLGSDSTTWPSSMAACGPFEGTPGRGDCSLLVSGFPCLLLYWQDRSDLAATIRFLQCQVITEFSLRTLSQKSEVNKMLLYGSLC